MANENPPPGPEVERSGDGDGKRAFPDAAADKQIAAVPSEAGAAEAQVDAREETAACVESEDNPSKPFPIVGVGASAGGLDAFTELLRALREDTGMAFVLVQHMDPTHESVLNKLLSRETAMSVTEVQEGTEVQPNHIYVIPPNTEMTIRDGILRLAARRAGPAGHMPIDTFFAALARDQKSLAMAVVLSGVGSDGTQGCRAIKAEGGITFAQEEKSAKFPGMPTSAVASGCVDFVLPVRQIASQLARTADPALLTLAVSPPPLLPGEAENGYFNHILRLLRARNGVDFSYYKPNTLRRRIARRMILQKTQQLGDYVKYMEEHPAEAEALFEDILIHVTSFFREPEVFEALQETVFPRILKNLPAGDSVRIWVPGCSSGEEVYSLAIALLECLGDSASQTRVQFFGTDISMQDIETARTGIYSASSLAEVAPRRLRRYFAGVSGGYQISKMIRDMCVFARHDLAKDPPFSKLDLISCRNVLIYLGPVLQRRVMSVYHYALKPDGFLLLGKSETISAYSNLFLLTDRKNKIYGRKHSPVRNLPEVLAGPQESSPREFLQHGESKAVLDARKEADRITLGRYAPPGFFVDSNLQILHFQGDTSPFLKPSAGEPSFDLVKMIRPELVLEARKAIFEAKKNMSPVRRNSVKWESAGNVREVDIEAIPIKSRDDKAPHFLILLLEPQVNLKGAEPAEIAKDKPKNREELETARLKKDLESTREYLRSILEDSEASSEELRAANEEILSSNEELQSTNEELETAKEELQSANEELTTLNEELQTRNLELTQLANDLSNLLVGVEIPIVILGADRRIRRYTPAAERMFNLISSDVGRPIGNIKPNLELPDMDYLITAAMSKKAPVEREVQDAEGHWYALRLRPYITLAGKVDAVLIALVDIDSAKRASAAVVETMRASLIVLSPEYRVVTANPAFYETFRVKEKEIENHGLFELKGGQWDIPELKRFLAEVMSSDSAMHSFQFDHTFPGIGYRSLLLNVRCVQSPDSAMQMLVVLIEDLTEGKLAQEKLHESEAWLRSNFEGSLVGMSVISQSGKYLKVNAAFSRFTGYSEAELREKTVLHVAFPEDRQQISRRLREVLAAGEAHYEQRFQHKDGNEVWGMVYSARIEGSDGRPLHINTQVLDITARRGFERDLARNDRELLESQHQLRALAGMLITEKDETTRMLAREAHDVFAPRLVTAALKLSEMERQTEARPSVLKRAIHAGAKELQKLADEAHDFARRIHPATLEELGLVTTLKAECVSFSRQQAIAVKFSAKGVPKSLSKNIALSLYRVAQEALLNVKKHARAKNVHIGLSADRSTITLTVRDDGRGFDMERARRKDGLGFISMEERVRLVGGELQITSRPGEYTLVEAHAPLRRPRRGGSK